MVFLGVCHFVQTKVDELIMVFYACEEDIKFLIFDWNLFVSVLISINNQLYQ